MNKITARCSRTKLSLNKVYSAAVSTALKAQKKWPYKNPALKHKILKRQTWKNLSFSSWSFISNSTWSTKLDSGNSTSAKHGWQKNMYRRSLSEEERQADGKHSHAVNHLWEGELTCAAHVDTRALILSRCISMLSASVTGSARHNSRTTCNKWFHLRVKLNWQISAGKRYSLCADSQGSALEKESLK